MYRVYDMAGELVKRSATGQPGANKAAWDASGLASGLYFAIVEAYNTRGGLIGHKDLKIILVK